MAKIVIIGGGVIGSSIAYHLAQAGNASDVVVVEPDPTYEFAATLRATGGIRQLYTVPENIRMSQYGHEVYGQFETLMAVNGEPPGILLALAKVEFGQPKHFGREPANILNREVFRMPAQRAIDPNFMTHAESKMDISGCLRRRY